VTQADTGTVTSAMILNQTILMQILILVQQLKQQRSRTAVTQADAETVTSAMILNGTIVNGDISATAAIDQSRISGLSSSLNAKANYGANITGTVVLLDNFNRNNNLNRTWICTWSHVHQLNTVDK
jgi:hypothetical protein